MLANSKSIVKNLQLLSLIVIAAIVVASVNIAFAAPLTTPFVSPSSNYAGKASQYAVQFTTASTDTIAKIKMDFPTGTLLTNARVIDVNGIGVGTLSVVGDSLIYTVTSPQSISAGVQITLFVGKIANSPTAAPSNIAITTLNGSDGIIDGPTNGSFTLQTKLGSTLTVVDSTGKVGIGTSTPAEKLDVIGNIRLTGNIVSPNDICIGTCP